MRDLPPYAVSTLLLASDGPLRQLYTKYVDLVYKYQTVANSQIEIGGWKHDCEADEVAFRSNVNTDNNTITWIRYIAVARRGSRYIYIGRLDDRELEGDGQGGGGALRFDELVSHFRPNSDKPLLRHGSIVHTDGDKQYRKLGRVHWPARGVVHDNSLETADVFKPHKYIHTCVHQKRKVGHHVA